MKNKSVIIYCILMALVLIGAIFIANDPAFKQEEYLEDKLLNEIPIGSTYDEVNEYIDSHSFWEVESKDDEYIEVTLSDIRVVFFISTTACFYFENSTLVRITISQDNDTL